MHDILPPKGMCSESRYFFKFREMSDNMIVKGTRQRHSCNRTQVENRMRLSNGTIPNALDRP